MLLQLSIRNIAVIESAEIALGSGLNILSGETGAGKSIIIDSVNLILGERADRTLIRSGADSAYVEALFDIADIPKARRTLFEMFQEDEEELVISRELSSVGRNVCRINGHLATLTQLSQITNDLIDIHGQHEHQSLLNPKNHITVLDAFCKSELNEAMPGYKAKLKEYNEILKKIEALKTDESEKQRRLDMLYYQYNEIENMNLVSGEDEQLRAERDELSHAEKIKDSIESAYTLFSGSSIEDRGVSALVDSAKNAIRSIAEISTKYKELYDRLESLAIECDDITIELRDLKLSEAFADGDLDSIEMRISDINKLKRKYGATVDEVIAYKESVKKQIDDLEESEFVIEDLIKKKNSVFAELKSLADKITSVRKNKGAELSENIVNQLLGLGMERARFSVEVLQNINPDGSEVFYSNGADIVEFMIATNPGEQLKPLSKIASGGEISRIMLALKTISSKADEIPTVIFDEIDTGISGNMASVVAQKLATIALSHQVICVTHTAQIAAMADIHHYIEKTLDETKAKTDVVLLNQKERYMEISRLVGGNNISQFSDSHAKEIIAWSDEYKQQIKN